MGYHKICGEWRRQITESDYIMLGFITNHIAAANVRNVYLHRIVVIQSFKELPSSPNLIEEMRGGRAYNNV